LTRFFPSKICTQNFNKQQFQPENGGPQIH
jgi:hypothetical protein